ncbi:MAG: hypothetical protein CVV25_00260 [Ignavibacteriae bacterium HGW-Ignavibacteriae-4]|jgi:hypothetical protein|nr:MAG: hypothetical protein CVV25_00260 [Ignavibacteriae bacterium HGW-Ignavibacteriae-4]
MKNLIIIFILFTTTLFGREFSERQNRGTIEYTKLDENSGMVVGIENPDIIWAINDGSANEIYGFGKNGKSKTILNFKKSLLQDNSDVEDIGIIILNNTVYLVLSDIGDNDGNRSSCFLYFVPEPKSTFLSREVEIKSNDILIIEFQYEDGPRDAECFFVDPDGNNLLVVTKREKNARLYNVPLNFNGQSMIAEFILDFPFGNNSDEGYTGVTAGDISKDGNKILIKDYNNLWYFERLDKEHLTNTFSRDPVRIDTYIYSLNDEPQGEAICWDNDNHGFFTASEEKIISGFDASLFYFEEVKSSVKKKVTDISLIGNLLYNNSVVRIKLELYNYIGQKIYSTSLEPFNSFDISPYSNQAHYLLLDNYKSIIKLR